MCSSSVFAMFSVVFLIKLCVMSFNDVVIVIQICYLCDAIFAFSCFLGCVVFNVCRHYDFLVFFRLLQIVIICIWYIIAVTH